MSTWSRRTLVPRAVAVVLIAVLYAATRLPASPEGTEALGRRFSFERVALPALKHSSRSSRPVRASLRAIAAWISSVGAAIALHDLDGDGLSNDVAYVDVRSDQVVIAPVPGSRPRY